MTTRAFAVMRLAAAVLALAADLVLGWVQRRLSPAPSASPGLAWVREED